MARNVLHRLHQSTDHGTDSADGKPDQNRDTRSVHGRIHQNHYRSSKRYQLVSKADRKDYRMHHVWRQARDTRLSNSRRICQSRKMSPKSRKQGSITKWIFRTTVHYRPISRRPNRRMAPTKHDSADNFYNGPYYQKPNRQRNSALPGSLPTIQHSIYSI